MKRIFIAVDISDEARGRTASYIDDLRRAFPRLRVGWERPEKLHLTIKFLGDLNESRLEEVQNTVREIADNSGPYRMTISGTGRFPPKGDPRILWLGASDGGQMETVASKIDDKLVAIGFPREKRRFNPHLTIARLREPRSAAALAAQHIENQFEPVGFEVSQIVIYESKLQPTGSIYSPIATYQFNKG